MKYKCIKWFSVYVSDYDGGLTDDLVNIEIGTEWEVDKSEFRMIGNLDDVRLEGEDGTWLEITKEHLKEYFERVQ